MSHRFPYTVRYSGTHPSDLAVVSRADQPVIRDAGDLWPDTPSSRNPALRTEPVRIFELNAAFRADSSPVERYARRLDEVRILRRDPTEKPPHRRETGPKRVHCHPNENNGKHDRHNHQAKRDHRMCGREPDTRGHHRVFSEAQRYIGERLRRVVHQRPRRGLAGMARQRDSAG